MENLATLRKEPHWSYSAINCYLNICSLQYYFRYVCHAEAEQTSAVLPFGRAFHAAASEQALVAAKGKCLNKPEIVEVFESVFHLECDQTDNLTFKTGETYDSMVAKAADMLDELLARWSDFRNVVGVAVPFKIKVPGLSKPLIGEYDLLITETDKPVIVDWKTSACRWNTDKVERDLQATCFCYAYNREHQVNPEFRFDVITKAKSPQLGQFYTKRDADAFARFEAIAVAVERAVNAGIFLPAETSYFCGDCPYASKCKQWHHKQTRSMFLPLAS